jgi:hypothetical protein
MKTYEIARLAGLALVVPALGAVMLCGVGCSTSGVAVDAAAHQPAPAMPVGSLEIFGGERMGDPELAAGLTPPDLTEPGSWARGTAEATIIDTRTFPVQIQPNEFEGEPQLIKNVLPVHGRDRTLLEGAPNDLVAAESTDEVTAQPGALFPGIDQTPWSPPDPCLAVGPDHVVQVTNMDIAWYAKDGTLQFRSRMDSTGNPGFFEEVGAGNFTFDPKCFYDHESERFFVVALEVYSPTQAWITFAISDDSDPNGVWYKYRTDARVNVGGTVYWVDYPGLGFDSDGIYVNGNLFRLSGGGGGFGGVLYRSIDKSSILSGGTAQYTDIRDGGGASAQAGQHFGDNQTPYFVQARSSTSMRIIAIRNPLTSPSLAAADVGVPSWGSPPDSGNNGGSIDALDGRIMNVMWRDGRLVACHGVSAGGRTVSRWYEFDTADWPNSGSPSLVQSGNVSAGTGLNTFFPAVYINDNGDIGMVSAVAGNSQFASVQFTGQAFGDPAGTMGALQLAFQGNATASGRWGDYFDLALDPDGCTFWLTGQYQNPSGWATWISSFTVTDCCRVDLNGDGEVNTQDVLLFLNLWNASDDIADWNGDGEVNTLDVLAFLNDFNAGC